MPIFIFHEDYTETEFQFLREFQPNITFLGVDFSGHEEKWKSHRPSERVGSYGYCMMCRFFSGIMQDSPFLDPKRTGFTHYMRLDDDSYVIKRHRDGMLSDFEQYDYVYTSDFSSPHSELWQEGLKVLRKHGLKVPDAYYTDFSPYNNFHVSSFKLWHNPIVREFTEIAQEGCLSRGWNDADTHNVLIKLFCPALGFNVKFDHEFSYRHNQQCIHQGPHTKFCKDGVNDQFPWGPPVL